MAFSVLTTQAAEQDAAEILDWLIAEQAGQTGLRWFLRMQDSIASLSELPKRCKLANEYKSFPYEIRELLVGRKPHVYRVLFRVENDIVYVIRLLHARRNALSGLEEPPTH